MIVKLHNGLRNPQVLEATRVVVEDDYGNVIFGGLEQANHSAIFACLGMPEYPDVMRTLGIHKTLIVHEIQEQPLSNVIWTG